MCKVIQKLSNRSQKIPKKFEKSQKNPIFSLFSYGLIALFVISSVIMYRKKSLKNCQKKKLKKKWFSFLQTFFLKSILDIFLCPISKLKKKFWKLQLFPFFDSLKNAIYPLKIDISYFFCWNRIFGGTFDKFAFFTLL